MSLEFFIDIRFADPVVALTLNLDAVVYGSMMGRVLHFNFETQTERVISERENECIRGAWLSVDNCLYYAVGDLLGVKIQSPELSCAERQDIEPGKVHTMTSCPYTLVLMHEDVMAFLTIDPGTPNEQLAGLPSQHALHITNLTTEDTDVCPNASFQAQSMPFDFDGKRILLMTWTRDQTKIMKLIEINPFVDLPLKTFSAAYGHITHAKLHGEAVVFVSNHRQLIHFLISKPTKHITFGCHSADIVAICVSTVHSINIQGHRSNLQFQSGLDVARMENPSQLDELVEDSLNPGYPKDTVIVSVDEAGCIKVWHNYEEKDQLHINRFAELAAEFRKAQYFSMGYPYLVRCCAPRIAVSTDHGVLVIKSTFLDALHMGLQRIGS